MAVTVSEVMTPDPIVYPSSALVLEAARAMRNCDIGDVLVDAAGAVAGIVTDRDIVVRAVADGAAPDAVTIGEICSELLVTLAPTDSVEQAIRVMREHSLRRVPVCDGDQAVGIVTLGDLAIERDDRS